MTMRLRPAYINHLKDWVKGIILLYGIIAAIYIIALISSVIFSNTTGKFSGMDMTSQIFIFVSGIVMFKQQLKLSLANGISRKTEFTSTLLAAATVSAALVIFNVGVCILYGTMYDYFTIFKLQFIDYAFANNTQYFISRFTYEFVSNLGSFIFGYFIGALYYRMNKILTIIVSVGVPVIFFIGLPILYMWFGERGYFSVLIDNIKSFYLIVNENPYYSLIRDSIITVVFAVFAFLLIRKAPIKEQM